MTPERHEAQKAQERAHKKALYDADPQKYRTRNHAQYQKHRTKRIAESLEWRRNNRPKVHAADKLRRQKESEIMKNRSRSRFYRYGITNEQWDALFESQNLSCAMCAHSSSTNWHTDHDHLTGEIRGILCHACNITLGFYEKRIRPNLVQIEAYLSSPAAIPASSLSFRPLRVFLDPPESKLGDLGADLGLELGGLLLHDSEAD